MQPYPGAPYYEGRIFSSGVPYSVVTANTLGVNLTDYAIGGATSGAVPGTLTVPGSYTNSSLPTVVEVPSVLEQVLPHLATIMWIAQCGNILPLPGYRVPLLMSYGILLVAGSISPSCALPHSQPGVSDTKCLSPFCCPIADATHHA